MSRHGAVIAVALALVALALILAACGGGDEEETTTSAAPSEAPSGGATPPSGGATPPSAGATPPSADALPPVLVECFADKGFDIESPAEIHSAPPQVVQACFASFHQGGGVP